MTTLLSNYKLNLHYLTLYDRNELEYILKEENKLRQEKNLSLLTIQDLENKDIVISKKGDTIDGYSITNFTFDENNNVSVLIEKLYETNIDDKYLHNELFESAIFVAVEKARLGKNLDGVPCNIIGSCLIIDGHTINFNINEEYIRRNLGIKFNKDAVKEKLLLDEKYKKERKEVEDKIDANTFYNDMGHRFHNSIDAKTGENNVVQNDFDILSLDERLLSIQQENLGKDINLGEAYQKFEKEKINVDIKNPDEISQEDKMELEEGEKDLVTAASIADKTNTIKIDVENGIAFDGNNKRIDLDSKKYESQKLGNNIEYLIEIGCSKNQIDSILSKDNSEWNSLSFEDKERIFELYGVYNKKEDLKKRNVDVKSNELDPQVKKLVLKNNNQAAYVSYVLISFISGLSAGIFITLLIMFLRR